MTTRHTCRGIRGADVGVYEVRGEQASSAVYVGYWGAQQPRLDPMAFAIVAATGECSHPRADGLRLPRGTRGTPGIEIPSAGAPQPLPVNKKMGQRSPEASLMG
jgi:hypothetical protein